MINTVEIKGFQSHVDTKITLSPGVNVIVGESDSGKSAFLRSLYWCFFNRPSGTPYVNKSCKECLVSVTVDDNTLTRERFPINRYEINGNEYKAIGASVPEEVCDIIPLDEVNFQQQLKDQYFLVLDSPGQITRTLSELLGFEVIDKAILDCKGTVQSLLSRLDDETKIIDEEEKILSAFSEVGVIESATTLIEKDKISLNEYKSRLVLIKDLTNKIKRLFLAKDKYSSIEKIDVNQALSIFKELEEVSFILRFVNTRTLALYKERVNKVLFLQKEIEHIALKIRVVEVVVKFLQLRKLVDSASFERSIWNSNLDSIDEVRKRREEILSLYTKHLNENEVCPYCYRPVDEEDVLFRMKESMNE